MHPTVKLEEEEQCDFCPRHGTVDQLFTLARILERAWEIDYPVYMLEKAYDRVPQGVLLGAQQENGVPVPLMCAIRSLYNRCESCVLVIGSKSSLFPMNIELCPGCISSLILFMVFIDRHVMCSLYQTIVVKQELNVRLILSIYQSV